MKISMSSGDLQKRIPNNFKECYEIDPISKRLYFVSKHIEKIGFVFFWILILSGIVLSLASFHTLIIMNKNSEISSPFLLSALSTPIMWSLYTLIEYISYHTIALLLNAIANIVQNTKIATSIALYKAAQDEQWLCKKCGSKNMYDSSYCQNCNSWK